MGSSTMVGHKIAAIWLGSLAISAARAQSWKEKKRTHQGLPVTSPDIFRQISNDLSDQQDFNRNLDAILIPRTVGSRSHARVKQHIKGEMRGNGWNVEEDSFTDQTPHGQKQFTNIIATLDPSAARRLVIACHYDSKIDTVRDDRSALDSKKIENFNKILRVFVAEYLGIDFSVGCNTEFCFLS